MIVNWEKLLLRLVIAGAVVTVTNACSNETAEAGTIADHPVFFDLANFVKTESDELKGIEIKKTVEVNGTSQTLTIANVDWNEELAPFAQSNLNRPALWDKYQVDSTERGERKTITYNALDSTLFTRKLVVEKVNNQPVEIYVHNRFSSLIAKTSQVLEWGPKHYEIYSEQYVKFGDDRLLKIRGEWE